MGAKLERIGSSKLVSGKIDVVYVRMTPHQKETIERFVKWMGYSSVAPGIVDILIELVKARAKANPDLEILLEKSVQKIIESENDGISD